MDEQDFSLSRYATPRRDFPLALFIPDRPPLVNSLQAELCLAGPGHAAPGRAILPLRSVSSVRPKTPSALSHGGFIS